MAISPPLSAAKVDGKLATAVAMIERFPNPETGFRRRIDRGACIVGGIRRQGIILGMGQEAGRGLVLERAPAGGSVTDLCPATC